jgi:polyhydroxybutyrate depolymerase
MTHATEPVAIEPDPPRRKRLSVRVSLLLAVALTLTTIATSPPSAAAATFTPRKACTPTPIPTPLVAGTYCRNLTVDGYTREYLLYVPRSVANRPSTSVPIVVMFHGSTGTGGQFLKISGWREKADAEGFVAAFPTGLEYFVTKDGTNRWSTKWNGYNLAEDISLTRRLPGYPATAPWPANDVSFTSKLLDDAAKVVRIDPARQYVSGFSNGGEFTNRLAIDLQDRIAAASASGGGLILHPPSVPASSTPAPMWLAIGSRDDRIADGIAPLTELPMDPAALLQIPLIRGTINTHAQLWGLPTTPCSVSTTTSTTTLRYCAPGKPEFRFTVIKDLTHHYPNGYNATNNPSGIRATTQVWPFYVANPL